MRDAILEAGRKFGCQSYPRWKFFITKDDNSFPVGGDPDCESDGEDDHIATEADDVFSGDSSIKDAGLKFFPRLKVFQSLKEVRVMLLILRLNSSTSVMKSKFDFEC